MNVALSQLLAVGRPSDYRIAVRAGTVVSFEKFRSDVAHNVARLKSARCRSGAPVCDDSYWFMVGFLALCHAGAAIVMPVNLQPGTLEALSKECDLLLTEPSARPSGNFLLEEGPGVAAPLSPFDPSRITIDFFTSGSTGSPKRVTRTASLLEKEVEMISAALAGASGDGLVSGTVSHTHVYGLVFRLLWPLSCGLPFSATTHDLWETVLDELEPGGVLVTSPAHLSRSKGIEPVPSGRAPSLVLSAGAPLAAEAARDGAALLGVYPTEIFGSTETGACAMRETDRPDVPWSPLPGVRFEIEASGCLIIFSPAIDAPEGAATADLVDFLPGGEFRFKGRSDRIVKIEGKRVSLPEVERQLSALHYVDAASVLVVGMAGERLGAVIVASAAGAEKRAALGDFRFGRFLRRELARTQESAGLPRLWRFVDGLPAGPMGKLRDSDLLKLFTNGDVQ